MTKSNANNNPVHPGNFVKRYVLPKGMTVTKAAELLGVGRPALSNFLHGKAALTQRMARRLEHTFGADRTKLLDIQAQYDRRDEVVRIPIIAGLHAPTLFEIKSKRIEEWANTTKARGELPALLRRLTCATGMEITRIDFPAFDNAQRSGWDGEVEATMPTPWIPAGLSVWEMGCDQRPANKANKDYSKRVAKTPLEERREATFIFVTPRNWSNKNKWTAEKTALGEWKSVRAYDANDLEQWLEQSAETQVWFAERLGEPVIGYRSPEMCWKDWATVGDGLELSPTLFSEVEGSRDDFHRWLVEPAERPFIVMADSPDEALAYVCHLVCEEKSATDKLRPRSLVFRTPEAMRQFRASNATLGIAIVYSAQVEKEIGTLFQGSHCVIVRPGNDILAKPDIRLGMPSWQGFSNALEAMGISESQIDMLARESGRSPSVLRRRLSSLPANQTPAWATDVGSARKLLPAALIGAWQRTSSADCEIVRKLARLADDSDVERDVTDLLNLEDSPLWSAGEHRGVVSRMEALFGIAKFVTEPDIDNFFSIAERVLSEPDPALGLPSKERWMVALRGRTRDYSTVLQKGVRETLVLFSVHGDTLFQRWLGIEGRISSLVDRLLTPLSIDKLLSHQDDLPDYAEAAPDKFLEIIEADLEKTKPAVVDLLQIPDSGLFGGRPQTELFWALESLAWDQFDRVSLILGKLAKLSEITIGDNSTNEPINILWLLYGSFLSRTAATLTERMRSLEKLTEKFPSIGWKVCVSLLKSESRIETQGYRPRWRVNALGAVPEKIPAAQFTKIRLKALNLVLQWNNYDQKMLSDLVRLLPSLSAEAQINIRHLIEAWTDAEAGDDEAKENLREQVRQIAFDHRYNVNGEAQNWARRMYDQLEPHDPVIRHAWLFREHWIEPSISEAQEGNYDPKEHTKRIRDLRTAAMKEIWCHSGSEGVIRLLSSCGAPFCVGYALEPCFADNEARINFLKLCLSDTSCPKEKLELCLRGFFWSVKDDLYCFLLEMTARDANPERIAWLYSCAPFAHDTWRLLDQYDKEIQNQYWRTVQPEWNCQREEELTEIIERLLAAKRPRAAFATVRFEFSKIGTSLLQRLLLDIGFADTKNNDPFDGYRLNSYDIAQALRVLNDRHDADRDEMVKLELIFIQKLRYERYGIPNLEQWISESPANFVQVLNLVFRRDDGKEDSLGGFISDSGQLDTLISAAYTLLERASRIPGTNNGGDIDTEELLRWIREVQRLCAGIGREKIGDEYIGRILAKSPAAEDGVRPCLSVSEVLEKTGSRNIANGFISGIRQARGVTVRAVGEGGEQERTLAEMYRDWARKRSFEYPYVGRILEEIASNFDEDARWNDDRVETDQRLDN